MQEEKKEKKIFRERYGQIIPHKSSTKSDELYNAPIFDMAVTYSELKDIIYDINVLWDRPEFFSSESSESFDDEGKNYGYMT